MNIILENFNSEEHLLYIEQWEIHGEIYSYLSNTRPRYLRDSDENLSKNTKMFMIKCDDTFIGTAWLEDITVDDAKLSIYIGNTASRGKGIGEIAVRFLTRLAFEELNIRRVYLNVRKRNEKAINCYEKCGFKITKEYKRELTDNSEYLEAYEMTLFKNK